MKPSVGAWEKRRNFRAAPGANIFRSAAAAMKYSTLRANINCCRGEKHKTTHLTQMPRATEACETIRGCLGNAQVFSSNPPARAFSGRRLQAPRNIRRSELISTATGVDHTDKHTYRKQDEPKLHVRPSAVVWRPRRQFQIPPTASFSRFSPGKNTKYRYPHN